MTRPVDSRTINVPKSATSDTRKLTKPHWPGASVRSGAIGGGTGNVCFVAGSAVMAQPASSKRDVKADRVTPAFLQ